MGKYVLRRFLIFVPTVVGATMLVFFVMRVMPGDVALVALGATEEGAIVDQEQYQLLREQLGLNHSLSVQYVRWLWGVVTLNAGESLTEDKGANVAWMTLRRFPTTVQLALYAVVITWVVAIPLGVVAALRQDRWLDHVIRSVSIVGVALPNFWVASLLILTMVLVFGWSPPVVYRQSWQDPGSHFSQMIWPALVIAWGFSSVLIRLTRSTMLEVMRQDYMRTAQAKGLPDTVRVFRHGLRNALIPVVTLMGIEFAGALNGSVVMEVIFTLPGIGSLAVQAIEARDYAVVQFVITWFVFIVLIVNLGVDLLYSWLDPRIRYD